MDQMQISEDGTILRDKDQGSIMEKENPHIPMVIGLTRIYSDLGLSKRPQLPQNTHMRKEGAAGCGILGRLNGQSQLTQVIKQFFIYLRTQWCVSVQ